MPHRPTGAPTEASETTPLRPAPTSSGSTISRSRRRAVVAAAVIACAAAAAAAATALPAAAPPAPPERPWVTTGAERSQGSAGPVYQFQYAAEHARLVNFLRRGYYKEAVESGVRLKKIAEVEGLEDLVGKYKAWLAAMKPLLGQPHHTRPLNMWQSCYSQSCVDSLTQKNRGKDSDVSPAPPPPSVDRVVVDTSKRFQTIEGFGGAFTEAAAMNYARLSASEKKRLMDAYFAAPPHGHGYTLGRIAINSCDFSPYPYNFDDHAGDVELKYFDDNVTHDTELIIPFIVAAQRVSTEWGRKLKQVASPWSPPAWMKVPNQPDGNASMSGSAYPQGLRSEYEGVWARYISRWLTAYKAKGVRVWAITVQNEPRFAAPWEACVYNATHEADFVARHLGPTLRKDHPDTLIFAYDHNKDKVAEWASELYNSPAREYIDGMAVHWYAGEYFGQLDGAHWIAPDKLIIGSEACCGLPMTPGDTWRCALMLGRDAVGDLNSWAVGWIGWNLLLDEHGGPNHLGNTMTADAMLSPNGRNFSHHPSYYIMGHLSRFIPPGSQRVNVDLSFSEHLHTMGQAGMTATQLNAAAFRTPDGSHVLVLINIGDRPLNFFLDLLSGGAFLSIPPLSAQTYTWGTTPGADEPW